MSVRHVSGFVSLLLFQPGRLGRVKNAVKAKAKRALHLKPADPSGEGPGGPVPQLPPGAKPPKERQILFDINCRVEPGEVLALMGPSGSGKTSLLSILSGRLGMYSKVDGKVLFNGRQLTKQVKRRIGYVMQDDMLFESLTVYETLYYAAMLRLPRAMSGAQKRARVEDVIRALGLDKCRGTIVGGFFRRGISGGERKRLSIGHELLINPSMVMLDEPTS